MNPNIDFLGICQLLKALRTVGFSENEIKKIAHEAGKYEKYDEKALQKEIDEVEKYM